MQGLVVIQRNAVSNEEIARLFSTANGIFCLKFKIGGIEHSIFNRTSLQIAQLFSALSDIGQEAEIWYYLPNGKGIKVTDNLDRLAEFDFGGVA